jgi:hypothetical protein
VAFVLKGSLSGAERDDAPDRVVGRDAYGHTVARDDFDSEAAHPAAQLGEYFMAGVALDSIQTAGVHGDNGPLHIYQVVFAQQDIL